ncbi:LOW QUALITY PROTEIN: uncharacterized protein LOC119128354 [Syngnathus acus]|uniref:LOW QUALITY PROTEIN: uncharacterized protein LOC119128354 n=1 Tax=Syngnathus acus TaxID=161584 RepID=UPI001885CC03|nr:LOW QUALITY PROTEIN: uncharacterized protein LOC119128354 [Syngnathus acus]
MALDMKIKGLLLETLKDLGQEDFKEFKFYMDLPESVKENADRTDIAKQLMNRHGENAGEKTIEILEKINNYNLPQKLRNDLAQITGSISSVDNEQIGKFKQKLQENLRKSYLNVPKGNTGYGRQEPLENVYTELNISRGVAGLPDKQHEVLQMEMCGVAEEESIQPCDIFQSQEPLRTMLTVGFAGIGKTFLVRKFVLDWASGETNTDVDFIFPFAFRELNLEEDNSFSLAELIRLFVWESEAIKTLDHILVSLQESANRHYQSSKIKILFVLDGLDESRLKLDLSDERKKRLDVTRAYPVEVLLAHLIKGNLLPCARVWITTRPQGAHDIPPRLVDARTEVKGFSDSQRLDYFRKRFPNDEEDVIKHIQKSRTIFIMCHLPIFCWLTATVLQDCRDAGKELPETLTEMYTEFLLYHLDKSKERDSQKSTEDVKALAKLAFQHLMKKQQIFYERDLRESGLDDRQGAKHSGVFTVVFKEVPPLKKYQRKMFQFIHLTVQEYLAALYVMMSLFQDNTNVLDDYMWTLKGLFLWKRKQLTSVHEVAIRIASERQGNLDLFLRFLLGLSLQSNQDLLGELLKVPENYRHGNAKTVRLIKRRIERNSPEENINLFYCLKELKDESLLEQIQQYLKGGELSTEDLPPAMWSALVFFLRASDEAMSCFDLGHYAPSEKGLLMLLPVVKASRKSLLRGCQLSKKSCEALASVLSSSRTLRHLVLNENDLYDDGLEALAAGLAKPQCTLQVLRLRNCQLSKKSCEALASVLTSFRTLSHLDLSFNDLYDDGLEALAAGLAKPQCTLQDLRLRNCQLSKKSCEALASVLSSPGSLRELDLSDNDLRDDGLEALAAGLAKPQCTLQVLRLQLCKLSKKSCEALASVLSSPGSLRELDLGFNDLRDDGLEALAAGLAKPQCTLQVLRLAWCEIGTRGCVSLAKALRSNPSHLQQLNLRGNNIGEEGKRALEEVQMDSRCSLKIDGVHAGKMALDMEIKGLLLETLKDLKQEDFKEFKYYMDLPESVKENADRTDIAAQLMNRHGKNAGEKTIEILEKINNYNLAQKLRNDLAQITGSISSVDNEQIGKFKRELQGNLRKIYLNVPEGNTGYSQQKPLENVYTELNITRGVAGLPDKQHEVLQMEMCGVAEEESIQPCDIFESQKPLRTMLTVGFAGIGKTFLVRKFVLDWASGETNTDVDFIFPFAFRELNLEEGKSFSLAELIRLFVWESKAIKMLDHILVSLQESANRHYQSSKIKILFVLDGLDESRLKLDLSDVRKVDPDVTRAYPMEVLLAHLIKGNLLPCARVWITTRPQAAHDIPPRLVDGRTEVKGFSDSQRMDYFRKRFPAEEDVIKHIQKSRTIFIMCHLPIFCWLTATVLQDCRKHGKELPETLTEMYTEFLLYHLDKSKERDSQKSTEYVKALAKLAFQQLMKKKHIFYESDLRESGLDDPRGAKHSGVFTVVFKEVPPLKKYQRKMFQFIHLTVQEYLAALYVMMSLFQDNKNVLDDYVWTLKGLLLFWKRNQLTWVHEAAIRIASESEGNLDLFLRFLLGLSLQCNQKILGELLKVPRNYRHSKAETVRLIKRRIERNSPEENINLFHCLNELKDESLLEQIQRYLKGGGLSTEDLPPAMWSALLFFLRASDEAMSCFELRKYAPSEKGLLMLLPVVKASQKSVLRGCQLSKKSCEALASVLSSPGSLRELELGYNNLHDDGLEALAAGLAKPQCTLQVLRLRDCQLSEKSCEALASVLSSPGSLRELDLSGNDLHDHGLEALAAGLAKPQCTLQVLWLQSCKLSKKSCEALASILSSSRTLRHLDLNGNDLCDDGLEALAAGLAKPQCTLQVLGLVRCKIGTRGCVSLAKALRSNPSHLQQLDLGGNHIGEEGKRALEEVQMDSPCSLKIQVVHAGTMALDMKIKGLLLETLKDLRQGDFKKFKFHMDLPESVKENPDRTDIAAQLMNRHGKNAGEKTIEILEKIAHYNLAQKLRNDLPQITGSISSVDNEQIGKFKRELQENLRKRYLNVPKGNTGYGRQEPLENVYTELNITRGVASLPDKQHEVLQMEMCGVAEEESIQPCDIFQSQEPLRTMLTVGFAGIGKTFLVRKFVLDWASGETNTDVDFIFPFAFRELNFEEEKSFSLAELIRLFVWESKAIKLLDHILVSLQESANRHYQSSKIKILFVLDGLNESRLKLDLSLKRKVYPDVTRAYPVEVLLAHLIKGNLLPCAQVWITTRPQAAHDIPPRLVDGRTEVKGFSDSQRLDYFRKRFPDKEDVINHIQRSRTIFIMCHLPIFCWLTATVLQDCRDAGKELPETLTEMYTEFLLYHLDKSKERDSQKSTEYVKALAKLAFQQLMKKQQIFYESDLRESGLDDPQGAKHSGVFTVVFKEVPPLKKYQRKRFQFIHLTVQEYLAALYVMMSLFQDNKNVLDDSGWTREWKPLTEVHAAAIRKASKSEGNLDLFLRFLLGLSLQCNQDLLGELLKVPKNYRHGNAETVHLIKRRIERNSPEENIDLFSCLKELKDESLLEQIQQYLKGGRLFREDQPPAMWSALLFFLRASDEAMSCFELRKYAPSEKGLLMLLPVVKASHKSVLENCNLSKKSCEALASVLSSSRSLSHLDLSWNDLHDDGLEALATGLAKPRCTLQVLRLFCCKLSKKSCEALASVLSSPGSLRHLDLSWNDLHDDGLEALAAGLAKPQCTLQVLRLVRCEIGTRGCVSLAKALRSNPSHLQQLNLGGNDIGKEGKRALGKVQMDSCGSLKIQMVHAGTMALDMRIKDLLLKTLEDLEQEDFKKFKYYMNLPKSKKENADRIDIAEQLANTHGKNAGEKTIEILEKINNYNLAQKLRNDLAQITGSISSVDNEQIGKFKRELQGNLRKIYLNVPEGNTEYSRQKPLENVYTELNITRGVAGLPDKQHEVLQMEMCGVAEEESIQPCDIFQSQEPLRTMLTVGFAGIGKTFLVRKFVLDWASGRTNTDVDFIFPFAFRELNLEEEKSFSLAELIRLFVWESEAIKMLDHILVSLQESANCHYQSSKIKILFVLDGLDESRLKLDLSDERKKRLDVTRAYPVEVLLAHLIKGNLLPCARVWITTRPQAAHDIPPRLVDGRTEVKGFSDSQRLDYFRKRFPNDKEDVIKHIQKSRTIFIMCHLPIFCWLTATVLQDCRKHGKELPETLTEMYTEFLLYHLDKSKERDSQKSAEYVKALAKLAFQQLMKKQQIFYESDLQKSGLDYLQGAKHSGVFTVVFKEVPPLKKYQRKMFQFIHLTVQEYLAALSVMMSLFHDNKNVLDDSGWTLKDILLFWKWKPLAEVHEAAIHKASESEGNLDLFLRFLLGLSLQCNQDLLGELLKVPENYRHGNAETVRLIKRRIERNSPEENINLFYCLKELKDESLLEQIQQYLKGGKLSTQDLPPAMWSALVFFLRASDEAMSCFDLRKYAPSEKGLLMLLPVVKASQKSVLQHCELSKKSCEALASVLSSPGSLSHLDLSWNNLRDDGVEALAAGLAKPQCTLQVLKLYHCQLSKKSCEALASVLSSSRTLSHLDLSSNDLRDDGLEALTAGLAKPQCTLEVLGLYCCKLSTKSCEALASVLSSPGSLNHLDLSGNDLHDHGLYALSAGLAKPRCTLQVLKLRGCQLSKKSCEALASVLSSPGSLRELDLAYNDLRDDGLEALAAGLAKPQCTLQVLWLRNCQLSKKSCEALASVLSSPGSLRELDLSWNDLHDDGLEVLAAGLAKPQCTLQVLRLRKCQLSKKSCEALASVLSSSRTLSHLDLSWNNLRDDGVEALAAGLAKPQCTLQVLKLCYCQLSKKSCEALASVLSSPGSLRELELGYNDLCDDGLEALAAGLAKPQCTLQVLKLRGCKLSKKSCEALASVLSSPGSLSHLDLSWNNLRDDGVEALAAGLAKPQCTLQVLKLRGCKLSKKSCEALASILSSPGSLRKLDLAYNDLRDDGLEALAAGLAKPQCTLQVLGLQRCKLSKKSCEALASVLSSPGSLRELDLGYNDLCDDRLEALAAGLAKPQCTLQVLKLQRCKLSKKSCEALASVLSSSRTLSHLDLSWNDLHDDRLEALAAGLAKPQCTLQDLGLVLCEIGTRGCVSLAKALRSNPSHLQQLDLSSNDIGEEGKRALEEVQMDSRCSLKIKWMIDVTPLTLALDPWEEF